ncbi:hypothetical protein BC938DRAFT_471927 [Jimgerdemannia flammicorona]|uniref:Uncharacterized protein n=1 Tax=Jimgerdemannia flammicorona TaxID=994334 RepID=A0A433Q743_9FUNG|nr:hypothetical protein BC938DRAFT_471927 [Jimgerdemannia flammicorona]
MICPRTQSTTLSPTLPPITCARSHYPLHDRGRARLRGGLPAHFHREEPHPRDQACVGRASARPVDVECCLDILLKMMQHLQKGDEHPRSEPVEIDEKTEVEDQDEVVKKRREDEEEAVKLIDTAFLVTISLLSCTDRGIRNKVLNNCIPAFFSWEVKRASYVVIVDGMEKPNRRGIWCKSDIPVCIPFGQMVWDRSCQIFALPATNLLRLEVYGIFARLFDYYFGYVDDDDTRKGVETVAVTLNVGMDLRYEEKFFEIVQSGLKSSDSLARKYSVYILKRVIDYTQKNLASTQGASWTKQVSIVSLLTTVIVKPE